MGSEQDEGRKEVAEEDEKENEGEIGTREGGRA
jgi:hypothetical protein